MWTKSFLRCIPMVLLFALTPLAQAQVTVQVNVAPPELPVYTPPPLPGDGYIWTPGYWAWSEDDQDYYWVPGTWVLAPEPGYLWTPGFWGWESGVYLWHAGYWGPHVGFYGGVNYGYGYGGEGYQGGYWQDGHMYYNRAVVNVNNVHVTNVYNKTVINNVNVTRVSYNGGNGGVTARPSAADERAAHDRHIEPTGAQRDHVQQASRDTQLRAAENHGKPPIAATEKPGSFSGAGVVSATRGGQVHEGPRKSEPARSEPRNGAPEEPRHNNAMTRQPPAPHPAPAPRQPAESRPPEENRAPPTAPREPPHTNVERPREPAHTAPAPRPPHPEPPRPPQQHPPEHPPPDHEHH